MGCTGSKKEEETLGKGMGNDEHQNRAQAAHYVKDPTTGLSGKNAVSVGSAVVLCVPVCCWRFCIVVRFWSVPVVSGVLGYFGYCFLCADCNVSFNPNWRKRKLQNRSCTAQEWEVFGHSSNMKCVIPHCKPCLSEWALSAFMLYSCAVFARLIAQRKIHRNL